MKFFDVAHGYQKKTINFLLRHHSCGVFLDMGMGKTASVLYAFYWLMKKGKAKRMLIIAPKYVGLYTWGAEIEKWDDLNHLTYNIAIGNENKRYDAFSKESDIVIVNRDNVNWMMKNVSMKSFDVLVLDELSSFKNAGSIRTKSILKVMSRFKYRWGLTGTPCPNTYLDLFGQMSCLHPDILGYNYYAFRSKYFYEAAPYVWQLKGGAKEALEEHIGKYCMSLSASDYLQMPELIENHIDVHMDVSGSRKYKKAIKELKYKVDTKTIDCSGNLTIKLQQLAAGFIYDSDKNVSWVHDQIYFRLKEILDTTSGNVLLFYNFIPEKDRVIEEFGAIELKSNESFNDWNAGNIKLAIAHPNSVGYGMNLQSGGSTIIWIGYNWALDTTQQANARLYRQGQIKNVIINYIYTRNTIHESIRKCLDGKMNKQDLFIESLKYLD